VTRSASSDIPLTSADGTRLGVTVCGDGPPLVVVHGSLAGADDWRAVRDELARDLTVYSFDRRGRGTSGDGHDYALERELEDVRAVLDAAGTGAVVFGHSFGGLLALRVAATTAVAGLVVYEPGLALDGPRFGDLVDRYQELVDAGDLDGALEYGMATFVEFDAAQIEAFRSSPAWAPLATLTPTWGRELKAIDAVPPGLDGYRGIDGPALMLVGENSPEWLVSVSRQVHQTLPGSRLVTLQGQSHDAHVFAPQLLARKIVGFVQEVHPRGAAGTD